MVTIKDGCGCDPCDCDWKQKLKEAYARAIQSVNKIGDETGRVYYPDGTGFVKMPLPTKEQIDSLAQVDAIKASVDELNKTVPALETQVAGVTESLVSDVEVLNGTTAGKFKVRIEREKAALIDSNEYDLSKVNSIELIQGSGPAMVKAQLTLSDGTVLRSDDFLFTSESIGTDVYISSFTFKNGNVDGTISADIGLNNGTTLEANNFVVPTDPSVVTTITDLQTRMTAVENGSGVSGLNALKVTVETHTTEITQLTDDVGNLMTSKVDVSQGTVNAGKALIIGSDGNVTPGEVSGGEVWELVDNNNWPTDWKANERIKITTALYLTGLGGVEPFSTTSPTWHAVEEMIIPSASGSIAYGNYTFYYTADVGGLMGYAIIIGDASLWPSKNLSFLRFSKVTNSKNESYSIDFNNLKDYIKIWRLKK